MEGSISDQSRSATDMRLTPMVTVSKMAGVPSRRLRRENLEPIQEVRNHDQAFSLVKRRSMRRIMARRKNAATVRA